VDSAEKCRFTLVTASVGLCTICVQKAGSVVDDPGDSIFVMRPIHSWVDSLWTIDPLNAHCARTCCAHVLRRGDAKGNVVDGQVLYIQLLPYVSDLLPYNVIKFYCFFDLFNRVDCGGVVFAPQFAGDFRKAQVKFRT
jgi:hypothetical protein